MRGVEFVPSDNFLEDVEILREFLRFFEADFVLIPDNPLGNLSVSSVVSAKMLGDRLGIKTIATIGGRGKSRENVLALIKGAQYASLGGIACVSGDGGEYKGALKLFELAQDFDFEFKISTLQNIDEKIKMGATHAITQPIFDLAFEFGKLHEKIPVFVNFMPIFSHSTFEAIAQNQKILGFGVSSSYQNNSNLMEANQELLRGILCVTDNLYLTPLNLKKQISYLKKLFTQ